MAGKGLNGGYHYRIKLPRVTIQALWLYTSVINFKTTKLIIMNKLLSLTMPMLLVASFLLTSCEKEPVKNEVQSEPVIDLKIKVEWQTVNGEDKYPSGTGRLEINPGTNNTQYKFTPTIPSCCDAKDVKFDFKKPKGMSCIQDSKTGVVALTIHGEGTWVFIMICTCNGVEHRAIVTIVV